MSEKPKMADVFDLPLLLLVRPNSDPTDPSAPALIVEANNKAVTDLSMPKHRADAIIRAVNMHDEFMEAGELVLSEFLSFIRKALGEE